MPSSIVFNGVRRYRPNVYTRVINNLGEATSAATGNIALVGDFPELKQATPITFTSELDFQDWFKDVNSDLSTLGKLMFKPLEGDGSPTSLTVVSANESSQASVSNADLKISSRLFGVSGNRLFAEVAANADDAELYDLTVKRNGVIVEEIEAHGEGTIATIDYTTGGAGDWSSVYASIDDTHFNVLGQILVNNATIIAGNDMLNAGDFEMVGNVNFTVLANQASNTVLSLSGLSPDGTPISETIAIPAATQANDSFVSTREYSELQLVRMTTGAANFVGNITLSLDIMNVARDDISNFEDTLNELVALNDAYVGDFAITAPASIITGADLDNRSAVQVNVTQCKITADLKAVVEWFDGSEYVSASREGNDKMAAFASRLTGGSADSAVSANDWQAALDSIKRLNINIVTPFTNDQGTQDLVAIHAVKAAEEAGYERNVWVGTTADISIANAFSGYTKKFNDRNVAVTSQNIKVDGVSLDPRFTAALLAAIQGSTPIATPLTRKRPTAAVTETSEGFKREDEAALAIRRGLVFFADPSNTGLRIERSVTSWLSDDNPVYSEVSANESVNNCIREVRFALQDQIGEAITAGRDKDVERVAQNTLFDLKSNGLISDFRDLSVSIQGDVANVVFSVAALEPLNFITVTTNVVR
jgi:hypothetical protein